MFDLDGTLVDSQRDLANAANALVAELGGAAVPDAAVAAMVGEGAAVLVRRVLDAASLDPATPNALSRFIAIYEDQLAEHTRLYDGMATVLDELRPRVPLAVLTNKPQRATDRLLGALKLTPYFSRVLGGDTPWGRKPLKDGLVFLCGEAGVSPADTILVGDSPIDLQTARNAGTRILLARYGFGFRFTPDELTGLDVANTPMDLLHRLR